MTETDVIIIGCHHGALTEFFDTFRPVRLQNLCHGLDRDVAVTHKPASKRQFRKDFQGFPFRPGERFSRTAMFAGFPGIPLTEPLAVECGPSGGQFIVFADDLDNEPQQHGIGGDLHSARHRREPPHDLIGTGLIFQVFRQIKPLVLFVHGLNGKGRQPELLQVFVRPRRDGGRDFGIRPQKVLDILHRRLAELIGTLVHGIDDEPQFLFPDQLLPLCRRQAGDPAQKQGDTTAFAPLPHGDEHRQNRKIRLFTAELRSEAEERRGFPAAGFAEDRYPGNLVHQGQQVPGTAHLITGAPFFFVVFVLLFAVPKISIPVFRFFPVVAEPVVRFDQLDGFGRHEFFRLLLFGHAA